MLGFLIVTARLFIPLPSEVISFLSPSHSLSSHFCTLGRDISLATALVHLAARKQTQNLLPASSPPPGLHSTELAGFHNLSRQQHSLSAPTLPEGMRAHFTPVGPFRNWTKTWEGVVTVACLGLGCAAGAQFACLVLGPLQQVAGGAGRGGLGYWCGEDDYIHFCFPVPSRKAEGAV